MAHSSPQIPPESIFTNEDAMFELDGVSDETAREALILGAAKLPIKTRIVTRLK